MFKSECKKHNITLYTLYYNTGQKRIVASKQILGSSFQMQKLGTFHLNCTRSIPWKLE